MHPIYSNMLTFVSISLKTLMRILINPHPKERLSILIMKLKKSSTFPDLVLLKFLLMELLSFLSFNQIYGQNTIELQYSLKK